MPHSADGPRLTWQELPRRWRLSTPPEVCRNRFLSGRYFTHSTSAYELERGFGHGSVLGRRLPVAVERGAGPVDGFDAVWIGTVPRSCGGLHRAGALHRRQIKSSRS